MKSAFITHLVSNNPCHKDLVTQILAGLSSLEEKLKSGDRSRQSVIRKLYCGLSYPLAPCLYQSSPEVEAKVLAPHLWSHDLDQLSLRVRPWPWLTP